MCKGKDIFDKALRILSWNQDIFIYKKVKSHKFLSSRYMLQWYMFFSHMDK